MPEAVTLLSPVWHLPVSGKHDDKLNERCHFHGRYPARPVLLHPD